MLGSRRAGITASIAVLVGIAGMSYVLAGAAPPPGGPAAVVEFILYAANSGTFPNV